MESSIDIYVKILIALFGFILPILGILLSIYRDGFVKLKEQVEIQERQTEANIKAKLREMSENSDGAIDDKPITQNIKKLKKNKKEAQRKISMLQPQKQIGILFFPILFQLAILIVFHAVIPSGFLKRYPVREEYFFYSLPVVCILLFGYTLRSIFGQINLLVEVKGYAEQGSADQKANVTQILGKILEKLSDNPGYFVRNIGLTIDDKAVTDEPGELDVIINQQQTLKVSLSNDDNLMAKLVEVGLIMPADFLIETQGTSYTVTADSENQNILRYKVSNLQAKTNQIMDPLKLTPMKTGAFTIKTFIKGENVSPIYRTVKVNVSQGAKDAGKIQVGA